MAAISGVNGLYGFGGVLGGGLGQAQQQSQGGWSQNTLTTSSASTNTATIWVDGNGGVRCGAIDPAMERVKASLPRTLRAELQEEVDAWLPKLTTI